MRKRCKFLIGRFQNKPTPTSRVRGSSMGFCVRQHLEVFVTSDCQGCNEHTPGPPCQTMKEYLKEVSE